jgi:hypothetical protein
MKKKERRQRQRRKKERKRKIWECEKGGWMRRIGWK